MSDIEQLAILIGNILQPTDQNLRKQSEATLVTLRTERPNELISAFIAILQSQCKMELRNFSASQLRLSLSSFSPATYTNVWDKLTLQVKELVKVKLFETIYKQTDLTMKRHIADTLGQIAGSLISQDQNNWPEFKNHVYTLFKDSNLPSNLAAFYILETFFTFAPQFFAKDAENLYALFKNSFSHENEKLKLAAIKSFTSYLQVLETKKHKLFEDLIIPIYQAVYTLITNNNNEEGLEALSQMIDVEPKFFKKKFKELYDLLHSIFNLPKIESGVKRMATEMLVDYAQKYPALYRKKKDVLTGLIQMIFYHMVDISDEITQEWMKPEEGYNQDMQDDEDFETTRFGMGAIDRLIYTVGQEQIMVILSETIQQLVISKDWRHKYTAVMALSQVGQYIDEPQKISSIMGVIIGFLRDPNPMLRYSACHAIGQISDDMQPKFQQHYGKQILPELVNLLNDGVQRVVSHSAAALTNFLEGMKHEQIDPFLNQMMKSLIFHTTNSISLVKESCLSAISSVVEVAKQSFAPYLQPTVVLLFGFFQNQKYKGKPYKQLKGQSIQTLTIIASSVGGQMFQPVAQKLIELMIQLQQSQFEQTDPQKTYILAGWQRLCLVYGRQLAGYLDKILPSLFTLVQNVINNQLNVANVDEKDQVTNEQSQNKQNNDDNINTFQTQEAEVAISMLNVFIEQLKDLYGPYVQKTVQLLCKIIQDHPNEDVKEQACKCLPNLISAIKVTNQPTAIQMARLFMGTLVTTIEKQFDTDIMIVELETLKCVIEQLDLSFLSQEQVNQFSNKILKLLKSSDDKKLTTKNILNDQEIDQEEKQMLGEEIKMEEEVQVAISQLIGMLFKTHKTMTIQLAKFLISTILPSSFKEGQSQIMNKFGIFLIDDMIQYLGYDVLQEQWTNFGDILAKFTQQKSCVLRQAASYGLGMFASNTPSGVIQGQSMERYLQLLVASLKIPKGTEKQKSYGHCKDNTVAALGKFIKKHYDFINMNFYIPIWLSCLPLRFDKPQAIDQHELLCDIMLNKDEWILGNTNQTRLSNMAKVLSIFGEILSNAKIFNDSVKLKMKQILMNVNSNEIYQAGSQVIWGTLTDKQKTNLSNLANS